MFFSYRTLLHEAIVANHFKTLRAILEFPGVVIDAVDAEGYTPLHYACMMKDSRLLDIFLSDKYHMNVNIYTYQGKAPAHIVMRYGTPEMVMKLLDSPGIYLNIPDKDGKTPFILAAEKGQRELYDYFLSKPELNVNKQSRTEGIAAIHIAVDNNDTDLFERLAHHPDISFDLRTTIGKSPLHYAAGRGYLDLVKYLVTQGKCDVNATTVCFVLTKSVLRSFWSPFISHLTPLHYAAEHLHANVVNYLLTVDGVDPEKRDVSGLCPRGVIRSGNTWTYNPEIRFMLF